MGIDLAQIIRDEIDRQGITQYRIRADTGLSQSNLSRFLLGGDIRLEVASVLLDYLGLKVVRKKAKGRRRA